MEYTSNSKVCDFEMKKKNWPKLASQKLAQKKVGKIENKKKVGKKIGSQNKTTSPPPFV